MKSIYGRRRRANPMGTYRRSREEDKALVWCIRNNICISPRKAKWKEYIWFIDIEKGVYPNRQWIGTSPDTFGPSEIWKKISEYQTYYYDKRIRKEI